MILKIETPPITSFPHYTDLLATIIPHKGGKEWYYNNFIQLFADFRFFIQGEVNFREHFFAINKNVKYFYYDYNPFIKAYCDIEDFSLFFDKNEIVDRVKSLIDSGFYTVIILDRHLIKTSYPPGSIHPVLVYGYNEHSFKIAEFLGSGGKYDFLDVNFSNVIESYKQKNPLPHWLTNEKRLVSFKIGDIDYKFDYVLLKKLITDYYEEKNTVDSYECIHHFLEYPKGAVWGMGCYAYLIDYLKIILSKNEVVDLDLRGFYVMYDHKIAMCDRINFLLNNNNLNDVSLLSNYTKIRDSWRNCYNMFLKYTMDGKMNSITQMIDLINKIYEDEKRTLEKLLTDLSF
jgi:hypothetical protein